MTMARRKNTPPKPQRRPRAEIDRNYFFGDVFIKTGVAVTIALVAIALYTPFTLRDAVDRGMVDYLAIMGLFGLVGLAAFLIGRHLRREATHWDAD